MSYSDEEHTMNSPNFMHLPQYEQPFIYRPQAPPKKIHAFLPWSIFNMICCGLVPGSIALICSIIVRRRIREGNFDEAKTFSKIALIVNIFSIFLGLITWGLSIYYIVQVVEIAKTISNNVNQL